MFSLNKILENDTLEIETWPLCHVRLMDDSRYPWIILVPALRNLKEFHDVPEEHQDLFHSEIVAASRALRAATNADKMNVASLGNMVPQLHIHVIARFAGDTAWPGPVWGIGAALPYQPNDSATLINAFKVAHNRKEIK